MTDICDEGQFLGVAFSGGGFRATLFHLGVVSFLREVNQLTSLRQIVAVSGGSILAAHLVLNWEAYTGNEDEFRTMADEVLSFAQRDVRGRVMRRWPITGAARYITPGPFSPGMTDLFVREFNRFTRNARLTDLRGETSARPTISLLTTNLVDGGLGWFDDQGFHTPDRDVPGSLITVGTAVAASAAFPPLLPPVRLSAYVSAPKKTLGADAVLSDGGVYDNLGLEHVLNLLKDAEVNQRFIVSDASKFFDWVDVPKRLPLFRTAMRANDILANRVRNADLDTARRSHRINIVSIEEPVSKPGEQHALAEQVRVNLPVMRTDLDAFSSAECYALLTHGWFAARAALKDQVSANDMAKTARAHLTVDAPHGGDVVLERAVSKAVHSRAFRWPQIAMDSATYIYAMMFLLMILGVGSRILQPQRDAPHVIASMVLAPPQPMNVLNSLKDDANKLSGALLAREDNAGFCRAGRDSDPDTVPTTFSTAASVHALGHLGVVRTEVRDKYLHILSASHDCQKCDWTSQGWGATPGSDIARTDVALEVIASVANLLAGQPVHERSAAALRVLELAQTVAGRAYDGGGWRAIPDSTPSDKHAFSVYVAVLALHTLSDLRHAGIGWHGSVAERDRLANATVSFLAGQLQQGAACPGLSFFSRPMTASGGLTFRALAELSYAAEVGYGVPTAELESVARKVIACREARMTRASTDVRLARVDRNRGEITAECAGAPWAAYVLAKQLASTRASKDAAKLTDTLHTVVVQRESVLPIELSTVAVAERLLGTERAVRVLEMAKP